MRGTPVYPACRLGRSGIIPAYAGNTGCPSVWPCVRWDHPRVCGEHRSMPDYCQWRWGSSPRMRGTPRTITTSTLPVGIIPAYAGNTIIKSALGICSGDHPRVCGEHWQCPSCFCSTRGSSPRMRGTQVFRNRLRTVFGIIPAYAGNTNSTSHTLGTSGDHPRVCGEHRLAICSLGMSMGSSPRMRGTRLLLVFQVIRAGIIPAYAGNTMTSYVPALFHRDHPRVCGEHVISDSSGGTRLGSSPRMRGTRPAIVRLM